MDLRADQDLKLKLSVVDKKGRPTGDQLEGAPSLSLSDPNLGAISSDADGPLFVPAGGLGAEQIQASGQVRGIDLKGSLDVNIIAGQPAAILIEGQAVDPA